MEGFSLRTNPNLFIQEANPGLAAEGDLWIEPDKDRLSYFDGVEWRQVIAICEE